MSIIDQRPQYGDHSAVRAEVGSIERAARAGGTHTIEYL